MSCIKEALIFLSLIFCIINFCNAHDECSHTKASGFRYSVFPNANATVYMIGDVDIVLKGKNLSEVATTFYDAKGIIGIGASGINSISTLGEAFFSNDLAYVRSTDERTKEYFTTIKDSQFLTPFSIYVKEEDIPDAQLTYSNHGEFITLYKLYTKIYDLMGETPFCFQGQVVFKDIFGISFSKTPIYGEDLFKNIATYFGKPSFHVSNLGGNIFGCAANFTNIPEPVLNKKIHKALFINPQESAEGKDLENHIHALTTHACGDEKNNENIGEIYHLLSNTTMSNVNVFIYKVNISGKLEEVNLNIKSD